MKYIKTILPALIVLLAGVLGYLLIATKPTVVKAPKPKTIPQVFAVQIKTGSVPIIIDTVATLVPSQKVDLKSKVGGTINTMSTEFVPGAIVTKDTSLLAIDPHDYLHEVKKAEASLAKAKASYDVELGQQKIAQTELQQLQKIMPNTMQTSEMQTKLTLREPQLAQAKADIQIAQATLNTAKLNLERTNIKAPFHSLIVTRNVSTGQHISTSETLAELIAVDEYWADVALPLDIIYSNNLLTNPQEAYVSVKTNFGEEWPAEVIQIVGNLASGSRMGQMLIRIKDPVALHEENKRTPLLMGDQVYVHIEAGVFDDVLALPRSAVFNNTTVWIITKENTLKPIEVSLVWKDDTTAYIKSDKLTPNTRVLSGGLSTPVENLEVKAVIKENSSFEEEINIKEPIKEAPTKSAIENKENTLLNSNTKEE